MRKIYVALKLPEDCLTTALQIDTKLCPAIAPEIIFKILPKNCSQTVPEIVLGRRIYSSFFLSLLLSCSQVAMKKSSNDRGFFVQVFSPNPHFE